MARPIVKLSIQPGVSESVSPSREENGSSAGGRTRREQQVDEELDWDPLFRCGGRFQLWERNLNFGRGSAAGFGMATVTTVSRKFLWVVARADRRKFQERRQWRRFPLLERRMDCERER